MSFKFFLTSCLIFVTMSVCAQEPNHNLWKTLTQLQQKFPSIEYGWSEEGKDYYVVQSKDLYHIYTYYMVLKNNQVHSESLMVESTGEMPNAGYAFFIIKVKSLYKSKEWKWCDVDASILRSESIFKAEHRIEWADKFTAEFRYSNFLIFCKYNPDSNTCTISYFPNP